MTERMIAYCGLICTDCDAYVATQANDLQALERMARDASKQFGMEMTSADAMCDGCHAITGRQIGYCRSCGIRRCAAPKHIPTCAHCREYPCETLEAFSKPGSKHRIMLDSIWDSIRSTA